MKNSRLPLYGIVLIAALIASAGVFIYVHFNPRQESPLPEETRATQRENKGVKFKRPDDARQRGIEAVGVSAAPWRAKVFIDGRVVPNPQASVEVRAPFAGILRVDAAASKLRLGASVKAHDALALLEARFTPTERLDLKTKLAESEARHKSAEEVLKIRQQRLARLGKLPAGVLSQDDVDAASVQLSEARMQSNVALTQWKIWQQALETAGKQKVIVPIPSPITGEVAEIVMQPGATVDAGQLLVRIVDFRRILLRLEFPPAPPSEKPPSAVYVDRLDSPLRWRAGLRGLAPSLEPGLQKTSWLYEIMPDENGVSPRWQAGLYVRAMLDAPGQTAQPAIALPASVLLVHQGRTLVYIEKRLGRYERREVHVLGRDGDTLYVAAEGWLAGADRVVIRGAQVLLSEEFRSDVDDD